MSLLPPDYISVMGPFLTELFPTRTRGSAQGFAYNFGRGVGALFPALVGFLSVRMSLASAMALFAVVSYCQEGSPDLSTGAALPSPPARAACRTRGMPAPTSLS